MPESIRNFFEPRFSYDFSQVRIYNNNSAAKIAHSIQAKAFTFENDVVFGHGQYNPGTVSGRRLLAHELVHVIQQNSSKLSSITRHIVQTQRFQDCTPTTTGLTAQTQESIDGLILKSIQIASTWTNSALSALSAILGGGATAPQIAALDAHFGTNIHQNRGYITSIQSRFQQIRRWLGRFESRNLIICNTPSSAYCGGPGWCAYTDCPNTAFTRTHLCQPFFHPGSCDEPDMPSIMLHEAGRAAGLCGTCTPSGSAGYPPSPYLNSINNICAYAAFARDGRI